jgi:fused signal recognition particle receptor
MEQSLLQLTAIAWWLKHELVLSPLLFALVGLILAFRAHRLRRKLTNTVAEKDAVIESLRAELKAQTTISKDKSSKTSLDYVATTAPIIDKPIVERNRVETSQPPSVIADAPLADTSQSLVTGLSKTRSNLLGRLRNLFRADSSFEAELSKLEEVLVSSDIGISTAEKLILKLKTLKSSGVEIDTKQAVSMIKEEISEILSSVECTEILPQKIAGRAKIILIVGVNGVGKTSTIGKLAWKFSKEQNKRILLVACDTFRAAANQQLEIWANRAGATIVSGEENEKPSTVAYRGAELASNDSFDVVIFDTAGRLHTKVNLMNELSNVLSVIEKKIGQVPDEIILVLDSTTGQNALAQAREFHSKLKLTGMVITKLDGTAKGGIIIPVISELAIPVRYIGIGESAEDLKPFDAKEFIDALFAENEESSVLIENNSSDTAPEETTRRVKRVRREENPAEVNSH